MSTAFRPGRDRRCVCPACAAICDLTGEQLAGYPLYLCRRCGLRSALDALDLHVSYNQAYASGLYPDQTVEQMRRNELDGLDASLIDTYAPFFRLLKPSPQPASLLDVGCGGGRFCRAAARQGWKTLGIDVSEVALESARAVEPLEYQAVSAAEIAGTGRKFDVITAFEVIEHQSAVREFLKHIRATMHEGSRFLCTVPGWEHPEVRNATRQDWIPPVHLLFFTRASLHAVLALNGFEVLKTGNIPMTPPGILPRIKHAARQILGVNETPLGIWALAKPAPSP